MSRIEHNHSLNNGYMLLLAQSCVPENELFKPGTYLVWHSDTVEADNRGASRAKINQYSNLTRNKRVFVRNREIHIMLSFPFHIVIPVFPDGMAPSDDFILL